MKKLRLGFLFLLILVGGCSKENEQQLTRIDVQYVNSDESYGEVVMITDKKRLQNVQVSLQQVKWEPNIEAEMARREDVKATLFMQFDNNMPERLYEYQIWFNDNGTATIISNNVNEGYGTLNKTNTNTLKNELVK